MKSGSIAAYHAAAELSDPPDDADILAGEWEHLAHAADRAVGTLRLGMAYPLYEWTLEAEAEAWTGAADGGRSLAHYLGEVHRPAWRDRGDDTWKP